MKKPSTSKKLPPDFPTTPEGIRALLAAGPRKVPVDADSAYDPNDPAAVEAAFKNAIGVNGGGAKAIRQAHAEARRTRGLGKRPAKALISLRVRRDTLERWRATGEGWQTRMAEALDKLP